MKQIRWNRIGIMALVALLCMSPCVHAEKAATSSNRVQMTTEQTDELSPTASALAIEAQYSAAEPFAEGYAAVQKDDCWGYIDESGTMVIEPTYQYAAPFSEGRALVGRQQADGDAYALFLITAEGTEAVVHDRSGAALSASASDLFDAAGKPISYYFVNQRLYLPFSQLLIDYNGRAARFTADSICSDGLVRLANTDDRFVFVDLNGSEVISLPKEQGNLRFESVWPYVDGYAAAWVRYLPYERDGLTYPATLALLDRSGRLVFSGDYDMGYASSYDGAGISLLYDGIMTLRHAQTHKWGAVDRQGNIVIPFEYEQMRAHSEGLVAVKQNGLWGYVDVANGRYIIQPQYTLAGAFQNGAAPVIQNDKTVLINRRNQPLSDVDGIDITQFMTKAGDIMPLDTLVPVCQNGQYGYQRLSLQTTEPRVDETAPWAYNEVITAQHNELVPIHLQNQYTQAISRVAFAELLMQTLTQCTGRTVDAWLAEQEITPTALYEQNPFYDTSNQAVLLANRLGLIQGVSADSFAPQAIIKRQEAATLLYRAAQFCCATVDSTTALHFTDNDQIADYAQTAVSYVTQAGIMNGVGDNCFAPQGTYTKEQAILTMQRMYDITRD